MVTRPRKPSGGRSEYQAKPFNLAKPSEHLVRTESCWGRQTHAGLGAWVVGGRGSANEHQVHGLGPGPA